MRKQAGSIRKQVSSTSGFTLIELLIVIIVLGVLAMAIIPQMSDISADAKTSTCQTTLAGMRSAVELYYIQHGNVYPGAVLGGVEDGSNATAFVAQLTQYTTADGTVSPIRTIAAKYGPYIKGGTLPVNPYNNLNTVVCNTTTADITVKSAEQPATGWKFYTLTGVLLANDGGSDPDGTPHEDF